MKLQKHDRPIDIGKLTWNYYGVILSKTCTGSDEMGTEHDPYSRVSSAQNFVNGKKKQRKVYKTEIKDKISFRN